MTFVDCDRTPTPVARRLPPAAHADDQPVARRSITLCTRAENDCTYSVGRVVIVVATGRRRIDVLVLVVAAVNYSY